MANNLEIEAQRQALVASIRQAATALRECANKTDDFANYLQNVFPVPQPYTAIQSAYAPALPLQTAHAAGDGGVVRRRPGRPRKVDEGSGGEGDAVNGEDKKRKRKTKEKKPKDPNAPKRPPSAYLLYQNQVRKDVQAANPNLPYAEILTHISKSWGMLNEAEKQPYNEATEIAKADYEKRKAAYEASKNPPASETKSPTIAAAPATAHHDTSEDDEEDEDEEAVLVPIPEDDDDETSSEEEVHPPPKKKVRKSEAAPAPPAPPPKPVAAVSPKEEKKTRKEKERKERKERRPRNDN